MVKHYNQAPYPAGKGSLSRITYQSQARTGVVHKARVWVVAPCVAAKFQTTQPQRYL